LKEREKGNDQSLDKEGLIVTKMDNTWRNISGGNPSPGPRIFYGRTGV
jgi:hypothetical protein